MTQRVVLLQEPPKVGETYLVPSVRHYGHWWPVIGKAHTDAILGGEAYKRHIHIDIRFIKDGLLRRYKNGRAIEAYPELVWFYATIFAIIIRKNQNEKIEEQPMTCLREGPKFSHYMRKKISGKLIPWSSGQSINHFGNFEEEMEEKKKKLKGHCKICPHHGIPLGSIPPIDGIITCPGHMLDWSEKTGCLIRRTKREGLNFKHRTREEKGVDAEGEV